MDTPPSGKFLAGHTLGGVFKPPEHTVSLQTKSEFIASNEKSLNPKLATPETSLRLPGFSNGRRIVDVTPTPPACGRDIPWRRGEAANCGLPRVRVETPAPPVAVNDRNRAWKGAHSLEIYGFSA
jgi:hypothetical protein